MSECGLPQIIVTVWGAEQRGYQMLSVQIPQSRDSKDVG